MMIKIKEKIVTFSIDFFCNMMKNYFLFFAILLLLFSCKNSIEENCFRKENEKVYANYVEKKPFSVKEILKNKPTYLQIVDLKEFRSFVKDSTEAHSFREPTEKDQLTQYQKYKEKYAKFDSLFAGQFQYSAKQSVGNVDYAFARNRLGFWLTKIENNVPKAYFLGLSFSHYYINRVQTLPIVKDGELQLQGSLVKIVKVGGLPGYDDYSAMEDGKLFRIKLSDLEKDSDNDGYNDIFEESFGLNPNSKDTDSDGIDDFNDLNPLFKSEKNKFTQLFEELMPESAVTEEWHDIKKMHYFFTVYNNDCEYFQRINPEYRTLIVSKKERKLPYYLQVTDVVSHGFSKLKKDSKNENIYYLSEWGSSFTNDFSAEFKNGKWIIVMTAGTVV